MFVLLDPAALGLFPVAPNMFLKLQRFINGTAANSSGHQRLDKVNQTIPVLASGKQGLPKRFP